MGARRAGRARGDGRGLCAGVCAGAGREWVAAGAEGACVAAAVRDSAARALGAGLGPPWVREAEGVLCTLLHATISARSAELFASCVSALACEAGWTKVLWAAGAEGSALEHAARLGEHAILRRVLSLVQRCVPEAAAREQAYWPALHAAVASGEAEAAEEVLRVSRPAVHATDLEGRTALWLALSSSVAG